MLKGVPKILSPELLKILCEMGHGDEIVISDGNFPACTCAKRLVRCDGHGVPELLDAILKFFPLDTIDTKPVRLMATNDGSTPPIWETYSEVIAKYEPEKTNMAQVERYDFYEQAKQAYAVVATGEGALYANIILKKGVVV